MKSSKQLEESEIRALSMIVVGKSGGETDVASIAKTVLNQYLQSVEVFETYNHDITNRKYESDGIVSKK